MIATNIRRTLALIVSVAALASACGTLAENTIPDDHRMVQVDRLR